MTGTGYNNPSHAFAEYFGQLRHDGIDRAVAFKLCFEERWDSVGAHWVPQAHFLYNEISEYKFGNL
jgi:hypothetical protein